MSDYHKNGKLGFERNITILTMQVTRLEEQLKYARECNKVKDKYWDKIRVERNSFLLEKESLEERVKELETELYFCNRNKKVGEIVDERTKVETR
jgi:predicted RNase H-like nuclease